MFTVVEIDKTGSFSGSFTPYSPYVYSSVLAISPASPHSIASYWTTTFGASGDYNDVAKNITGVLLNTTFDVEEVSSLGDLLTQENSFYFDYDNQELYIHFPHFWTPEIVTIATGQGWGYCSDTVRYFRNQLYRPIVADIRPIDIRNSDMPIKRNAELYASSCLVKFGKNWRADSWQSDENKSWEQEVIDEHRVKKVQEYESLLMTKAEAGDQARGRIYKNGSAIGTQRTQTGSTYATFSENFNVVAGDLIQLYLSQGSTYTGTTARCTQFEIRTLYGVSIFGSIT